MLFSKTILVSSWTVETMGIKNEGLSRVLQHWKLGLPKLWRSQYRKFGYTLTRVPLQTATPSRLFLACTVDARLNMLKSLGIGAKDLPLPPLPPTVIQASAMASDSGSDKAVSTGASASGNCTTVVYAFPEEDHLVVGYLNEWINAYSFITSEYTNGRSLLSAGKAPFLSTPGETRLPGLDTIG